MFGRGRTNSQVPARIASQSGENKRDWRTPGFFSLAFLSTWKRMCRVEAWSRHGCGCFWPLWLELAKASLLRIPLLHMTSLGNKPHGIGIVFALIVDIRMLFSSTRNSLPTASLDVKRLLHTSGYCQLCDGRCL